MIFEISEARDIGSDAIERSDDTIGGFWLRFGYLEIVGDSNLRFEIFWKGHKCSILIKTGLDWIFKNEVVVYKSCILGTYMYIHYSMSRV